MSSKSNLLLKITILTILIAVFLILTNIPHLNAYSNTPENQNFIGTNGGFPDSNTYFAKMLQGQEGNWFYENHFTAELHDKAFVNTFYLALGHVSRIFDASIITIFHLARILFGIILFFSIYWLSSLFFKKFGWRILTLILSFLPLGFGWILRLFGSDQNLPDVFMGEGNNFLSLILFPHFTAAVALMIVAFIAIIKSFNNKNGWIWTIIGGLSGLLIALNHPYPIIVIWIVVGILVLMELWKIIVKKSFRKLFCNLAIIKLLAIAIIPAPLIIYQFYIFRFQDVFKDWAAQNTCPRGPLIVYFLGFGLIAFLAIIGLYFIYKQRKSLPLRRQGYQVIALWGIVNFLAMLIPFSFQRKLLEGAQVPLVILGVIGIVYLVRKFKLKKQMLVPSVLVLIIISSLSIIPILQDYAKPVNTQNREIYYSDSEKEAFNWIKENYSDYPLVLSKDFRGGYLTWKSEVRVYVGHWSETVDFYNGKNDQVNDFFDGKMNISEMRQFLSDNGVNLVYAGVDEDFDPPVEFLGLEKVFGNEGVNIFKTRNLRE